MRILVTGASGFVGRHLCAYLEISGHEVIAVVRRPGTSGASQEKLVSSYSRLTDWSTVFDRPIHAVVHLAGSVPSPHMPIQDRYAYDTVNVVATLRLARQAAAAGVRQFVFVSTAKVMGETSTRPLIESDPVHPQCAYALSKRDGEEGLKVIERLSGLPLTVIRPPLVYGPGVKGNFASMIRWVARGIPLPLGAVTANRRSMVSVQNLIDFIGVVLQNPAAQGQTFFVSEGADLSTAECLRQVANAIDCPARLWPLPPALLSWAAMAAGKPEVCSKLLDSFQVDIKKARTLLGWTPPIAVEHAMRLTVEDVMRSQRKSR